MFLTGDVGIIDRSLRGGEEVQEALILSHEIPTGSLWSFFRERNLLYNYNCSVDWVGKLPQRFLEVLQFVNGLFGPLVTKI